jgi:hypothetical protein
MTPPRHVARITVHCAGFYAVNADTSKKPKDWNNVASSKPPPAAFG